MRAHHSDTEHKEMTGTDRQDATKQSHESPALPAVTPGRSLAFKDALAASMAKFDEALHRLAK